MRCVATGRAVGVKLCIDRYRAIAIWWVHQSSGAAYDGGDTVMVRMRTTAHALDLIVCVPRAYVCTAHDKCKCSAFGFRAYRV